MIRKKILIASGGTGGHIFPALALGEKLTDYELYYSFDERSHSFVDLTAKNIIVVKISNNSKAGIGAKILS